MPEGTRRNDLDVTHVPLLAASERYTRAHKAGREPNPTLNDLAEVVELEMFASDYAEASAAVHGSTQMDGRVDANRARRIAGHNSAFAVALACGRLTLSEADLVDDDLDRAVDTLIAMSHQVATTFE